MIQNRCGSRSDFKKQTHKKRGAFLNTMTAFSISVYKNCAELYKAGKRISGVYTINPDNSGEKGELGKLKVLASHE